MGNASQYLQSLTEATARTESAGSKISSSISNATNTVNQQLDRAGNTVNVYAQQLNVAASATKGLADKQRESETSVMTLTEKVDRFGKSLTTIGHNAISAGESLGKLTSGLEIWDSFKEFSSQEKSAVSLSAILETNGREVEELTDKYNAFAQEIEDTTTHEADQVVELLKLAEIMDVTGDSAKRAVKNALALADAQGVQAESVLKATAALEQGSAQAISRMLPSLKGIKDGSEKAAEAQRLLANMYGVVGAITNTTSGKIQQLNNKWGNFKESIGEVVAKGLRPFVDTISRLIDKFNELPDWVKTSIAVVLALTAALGVAAVAVGTATLAFNALYGSIAAYITIAKLATIASYAWKTALIAGVAFAFYQLGRNISGAKEEYEKFDKSISESAAMSDKWVAKYSDATRKIITELDKIGDTTERKIVVETELENAKKELQGYTNGVKLAEKEVERYKNRTNETNTATEASVNTLLDLAETLGASNKELELSNKNLDESKKKLEVARNRVDALQSAYKDIKVPETDPKILEAIKKLNEEFELQVKTMGMSSDEIAIYKIKLMGATDEMLRSTVAAERLKRAITDSFNVGNAAESLRRAISDKIIDISIDFSNLSDFEKQMRKLDNDITEMRQRFNLIKIDVDFDETKAVNRVKTLERVLDRLKAGTPIVEDINAEQAQKELEKLRVKIEEVNKAKENSKILQDQIAKAESYRILAENELKLLKLEERKNQILSKGIEITKQLRTPFEVYTEKIQELRTLLSAGVITQDTFTKATQNATKSLDDAESSLRGVRQELEKLNAVSFKSIEASERIAKFRDTIREQVTEFNRTKDRIVPNQLLAPENIPIEKRAIDRVREFMEQQKKIEEQKRPFQVPITPQSVVVPRLENPVAQADNTLMQDRADMIKVLRSIDKHLDVIEDKPNTILGIANINT